MKGGRGNFRQMPEDFQQSAAEQTAALMRRYHAGQEVVLRWKILCGTWRPRKRPVIRTDWEGKETRFPSITAAAAATKYGRTSNIINAIKRGGMSAGYYWRYAEDTENYGIF